MGSNPTPPTSFSKAESDDRATVRKVRTPGAMVVGNTHPRRREDQSSRDEKSETGNLYQVQLQIGRNKLQDYPAGRRQKTPSVTMFSGQVEWSSPSQAQNPAYRFCFRKIGELTGRGPGRFAKPHEPQGLRIVLSTLRQLNLS